MGGIWMGVNKLRLNPAKLDCPNLQFPESTMQLLDIDFLLLPQKVHRLRVLLDLACQVAREAFAQSLAHQLHLPLN